MKWLQKYHDDFVNGEGIREVIFLSGCEHHCPHCFNKESWDFNKGYDWTDFDTRELIKRCKQNHISGVTFSGGDPIYSYEDLIVLLKILKKENINIWVYTGFLFEYLKESNKYNEILNYIDVLCDGLFINDLKSPNKMWVGSSNQRVINVQESLKQNSVILLTDV